MELSKDQMDQIVHFALQKMPNGYALTIFNDEPGERASVVMWPKTRVKEMSKNPDWVFVFSLAERPGSQAFFSLIENAHFKPGTDANRQFGIAFVRFSDMMWIGCRVPASTMPILQKCAEETNMRISNDIPQILSDLGREVFPINDDNVFILENAKKLSFVR